MLAWRELSSRNGSIILFLHACDDSINHCLMFYSSAHPHSCLKMETLSGLWRVKLWGNHQSNVIRLFLIINIHVV